MTNAPSTTGPESIVTSHEWSKKLKEAGWPQSPRNDLFTWIEGWHAASYPDGMPFETSLYGRNYVTDILDGYSREGTIAREFAAPTVEEILRRLPEWITTDAGKEKLNIELREGKWNLHYLGYNHEDWHSCADVNEDTLANAAAACWIFLKENNLIPKP